MMLVQAFALLDGFGGTAFDTTPSGTCTATMSTSATSSSTSLHGKKTWERRMDEAKKKHRPKLSNWSRDGFATIRNVEFLQCRELAPAHQLYKIDQVDGSRMDKAGFVRLYEQPVKPCVIRDIPRNEGWRAANEWTVDKMNARLKDRLYKVGEDDDGYKVKAKLKYFVQYMKNNKDDSPLYIFDGNFDGDDISKNLLADYKVPSYFTDDLFHLVGERRRPPYRWVLFGPERSGSSVHIDPLATSAWNTVLQGRKRWVLFPPETPRSIAKGLDVIKKGE
jgi:histone arginine demethylase JMJD6